MINLTLTTRDGETQELSLPLRVEDIIQKPMPYFLSYGKATVTFDTMDEELDERLSRLMPQTVAGGVKELSLLAYILEKADAEKLTRIKENLPKEPRSICELVESVYSTSEWNRLMERYSQKLEQELEQQRMTGGQLFQAVIDRAGENGDLERFNTIDEYVLADSAAETKLCSYEFDLLPAVNFGGSEGIYIDCYLKGKFDDNGRDSIHIGTIKTLSTDLEACKIMGELCGTLMYHENRLVNDELYLFDTPESIDRLMTRELKTEQAQTKQPELHMEMQM